MSRRIGSLLVLLIIGFCTPVYATNFVIQDAIFYTNQHPIAENNTQNLEAYVDVWLQWDNAWRNSRNHDGVWLFVKMQGVEVSGMQRIRHVPIAEDPEVLSIDASVGMASLATRRSADSVGALVFPSKSFRGDVRAKVRIPIDGAVMDGLGIESLRVSVFGIEVVYIPQGPFYVGAGSQQALEYAAFYRSAGNNEYAGHYHIESEDEILVGPEQGRLTYRSEVAPQYMGDSQGPIPAAFPKGYQAFYIMKYEISQGQYADFLNNVEWYAPDLRLNFGGPTYYRDRGTLKREDGKVVAGSPHRPANFISWEDGIAFLDWSGLRPMTDFEFTKAARGPERPIPGDYVWGTDNMNHLERAVLGNDDVGMLNGLSESELSNANRAMFGASYYWVMDLSGSLWEKVVTIGDAAGRSYTGAHGDGMLVSWGEANVENWPRELGSPRREKGFGYRGGGFYDRGGHYDLYRPHSRVAYRPFGNWTGGPRHRAYGMRGVRTAD